MIPKNRMRAIRSYGTVGVPAGNRRHYPEKNSMTLLTLLRHNPNWAAEQNYDTPP